jgi:hypothetical protein
MTHTNGEAMPAVKAAFRETTYYLFDAKLSGRGPACFGDET